MRATQAHRLRLKTLRMNGARLVLLVALLSVFGGCWASAGSATLSLSCVPAGAIVLVSGRAVGRCGDGGARVGVGSQTVEVAAPGRLPLRVDMMFEPWEQYELGGALAPTVLGLDGSTAGSGAP